jgi:dipeptidase
MYAGVKETAQCYQIYDPEKYSETSARWAIDFVDNLANLKFQQAVVDVRAVRDPWEEAIFQRQDAIEKEALRLYKQNANKGQDYLTKYCNGLQEEVLVMFQKLRDKLITRYTNNRE